MVRQTGKQRAREPAVIGELVEQVTALIERVTLLETELADDRWRQVGASIGQLDENVQAINRRLIDLERQQATNAVRSAETANSGG